LSNETLKPVVLKFNVQKPFLPTEQLPVSVELVERRIYLIRGQKVMLDSDLAELYQALTKNLNLTVRRNGNRFPEDFVFQLTKEEAETLSCNLQRYLPYAFTELGVAMLPSVLNSERAVQLNIVIMRAFVRLRELLATHKDLARKVEQLAAGQKEHGLILAAVVKEIKQLKTPPAASPKRPIAFTP
jgi:hypothetical protein